jgi:hypothetical protein
MINANELRIGNYIFIANSHPIVLVDAIINDPFELYVKDLDGIYIDYDYSLYAEPIPLTEEWLFRLGFNKYGDWFCEMNVNINISLVHKKTFIGQDCEVEIKNITTVHQLQNLYFALTGEELQIK